MRQFLQRLFPSTRRSRPALTPEKRLELFATVSDSDNCLAAVLDQLQETLEVEFQVVISTVHTQEQRLRAAEGLRVTYHAMQNIERERAEAKRWHEEQQHGRKD